MRGLAGREMWRRTVAGAIVVLAASVVGVAWAQDGDPLDPAHNVALPCEVLSTPGTVPRSAKNIAHLANVCGFVGTDVEFQSRTANDGVHDYAFVGTMGAGMRIFDITDPAHPFVAGEYTDPGWENDVQVRGDIAVLAFDPVVVTPKTSACLFQKSAIDGGVDIVRLTYDPATATFTTSLLDCVRTVGRGAHNATLHPSGDWLAVLAPSGNGWVDVVDLRGAPAIRYRIVGTRTSTACPAGAAFTCIVTGTKWSPHDISFSRDQNTMYVAAVNLTAIVDVTNVLAGQASLVKVIPNLNQPGGLENAGNIDISHQSDVSSDGKILLITDERGGGLDNTDCNADADGVIGAGHFWALEPIVGLPQTAAATPANPFKLGIWIYPNPTLAVDALQPVLAGLGRTERACTIHVFRFGGNGTAGPGPIDSVFDGVSGLPARQLTTAHYGAGVWWLDFSAAASSLDGVVEDSRSTWGNTRGWNVMPGADMWSAKEYKGFIYTGDMGRGFDVYSFTSCDGLGCVVVPRNTPGTASGGGQVTDELAELTILSGSAAGGKATFGFSAGYQTGQVAPAGDLKFTDKGSGKKVASTSIDGFDVVGTKATFTGRATVNGVPGIRFFVEVEDLGEPGRADTFRLVLQDGYAAGGVLLKGNIEVSSS